MHSVCLWCSLSAGTMLWCLQLHFGAQVSLPDAGATWTSLGAYCQTCFTRGFTTLLDVQHVGLIEKLSYVCSWKPNSVTAISKMGDSCCCLRRDEFEKNKNTLKTTKTYDRPNMAMLFVSRRISANSLCDNKIILAEASYIVLSIQNDASSGAYTQNRF